VLVEELGSSKDCRQASNTAVSNTAFVVHVPR
jgi:hypothetical protein